VTAFFTELTERGALLISGPETHKFLQGQTTCDLDLLTPGMAINGAYCTPQGRMVCDFRILGVGGENWLMCMHRGICDNAAAVFGKYIVFSRAEIRNASDDWRSFAVWGEGIAATLGINGFSLGTVWQQDQAWWVQTDDEGKRYECHVAVDAADEFKTRLAASFQPGEERSWQLAEIDAALAHLEPETVDMFIPQMLNYQLTGHVSFKKGCYTGQEVVARMHYRGKLKRPMYRARIPLLTDETVQDQPRAGMPVYKKGSDQSIGNVVNSAADSDGYRLLAVVTTSAIPEGVLLGKPDGPQLEFLDLPYELTQDAAP
jgi:folate-binding protein YgfZ